MNRSGGQAMEKVCVLGAGRVGSAIVRDLCRDYQVSVVDARCEPLDRLREICPAETIQADLSQRSVVQDVILDANLVVGAVPGYMGYQVLESVLEAGKPVVDISFFKEDPFQLDKLARKNRVTAVVDCGVAPGMSNMILGYHASQMEVERFTCLVGGLPRERYWPYQYRAPFSPIDVIEEYVRPARLVEHGEVVVRPALSEVELVDIPGVGTLEAFNTDGLRTLLHTMKVPFMKEKTLRYPGHAELMRVFRESGFFSEEPIELGKARVRPIDLTSSLLFRQWELQPGEEELTAMQIQIEGKQEGKPVRYTYQMLDRTDPETGITSMARTTGYTCTAVAHLILEGHFHRPGINPPEYVGAEPGNLEFVLNYLKERGVIYHRQEAKL
ncbi:MAG: saccharopine dehydrogenase [Calditrichaeota bacterium]|nr:MAG: saccharopine dehydrogenase [Calditrichota bacterium]